MAFRPSIRSIVLNAIRLLVLSVLVWFIWSQFRELDGALVASLLHGIGAAAVLIFLPYGLVILLDAAGWRECMTGTGRISLRDMFVIRLSTDAVMNTFPAGVAFAETLRPLLLRDRFGLRMTDAVAATLLSKINIAVAQIGFIITGLFVALSLHASSLGKLGLLSSPTAIAGTFLLAASAGVVLSLPYSGERLTQIMTLLGRLRIRAVQHGIERIRHAAADVDRYVTGFARDYRARLLRALALFLLSWFVMAFETWLILALLGSGMSLMQAIALEATLSIVKVLFFFIPSAVGAQEAGILTVLTAFGIPEAAAVAAAFIILRRGKELAWALSGIGLFAYLRINPFKPVFIKA